MDDRPDDLRPELELPLPRQMATLPRFRGYPVPWFVAWLESGEPEFRAMDPIKWLQAVGINAERGRKGWHQDATKARCWICGGPMQRFGFLDTFAFTIGPMCAINRVSSEPPGHVACAEWSARNCPFLARPHAKRRDPTDVFGPNPYESVAGHAITRNPGVGLVWKCARFTIFNDGRGKPLIQLGDPSERPTWWAEGRRATRAEVLASIDSGFPLLEATLAQEDDPEAARAVLLQRKADALKYLPAA